MAAVKTPLASAQMDVFWSYHLFSPCSSLPIRHDAGSVRAHVENRRGEHRPMNPATHPIRVLTVLFVMASFAAAAYAWAAEHTVEGFLHGLTGPNCGPQLQNCTFYSRILDTDGTYYNANLAAGNYHWTGSSWNEQCWTQLLNAIVVQCHGPSGNLPCQKYAFTSGHDPNSHLPWHGHNPVTGGCA